MLDFMPYMGLGITVVVLAFTGLTLWRVFGGLAKSSAERDRLLRVGVPARGRILAVQMGGMTVTVGVDRQLQLVMSLEVVIDGRPPYPAQLTSLVSELQIPQVQPGAWVELRVDPADPNKLALISTGAAPPGMGGFGGPPGMGGGWGGPPGIGSPPGGYGGGGYNPGGYGGGAPGGYGPGPGGGMGPGGYGPGPGYGAAMAAPMGTPVRGFRMPLGAKIGLAIGGLGALIGIGAAVMAVSWTSGVGGPSDVCEKAAKCCRKMAGKSASADNCDNYTKQSGPIADKVCEESLKSWKESKLCK